MLGFDHKSQTVKMVVGRRFLFFLKKDISGTLTQRESFTTILDQKYLDYI